MSDPAVDAATRVMTYPSKTEIACAREALDPIRSRHRPYARPISYGSTETERVCRYCLGPIKWPCPDARDAYSSEELSQ